MDSRNQAAEETQKLRREGQGQDEEGYYHGDEDLEEDEGVLLLDIYI